MPAMYPEELRSLRLIAAVLFAVAREIGEPGAVRRTADILDHVRRSCQRQHCRGEFSGALQCQCHAVFRLEHGQRRGRGATDAVAEDAGEIGWLDRNAVGRDRAVIMSAHALLPVAGAVGRGCLRDEQLDLTRLKALGGGLVFVLQQTHCRAHKPAVHGGVFVLV